jgi:N-acetyl-anhydromuramyl-L-alanine amidase AmpD
LVTLAPAAVQPETATAQAVTGTNPAALPAGCVNDGKVDYPGAIDCVLAPSKYDCAQTPPGAPCNYDEANRPSDLPIQFVVVHDIEGTAQDALNVFQDPTSAVSIHYIVGSDGTVYQVVREKDIAWHAGNYWYNQRAVGIEHAGFDATGYQWYNATEYLASAELVAYLLKKYSIPLDHAHIVGHGTVPAPGVQYEPNHVDPGPYWLWDYYFGLIHQQGVAYPPMQQVTGLLFRPGAPRVQLIILSPVMRRPSSDMALLGPNGTETTANFSFANLYTGPSTASPLIPHKGSTSDATNESFNIEPDMAYPVMAMQPDTAGTGATMYEIWYGEEDHASSYYADATLAWVAVRPGGLWIDSGAVAHLRAPTTGGSSVPLIYGRPDVAANMPTEVIGQAPVGATLVSEMTTTVTDSATGTTTLWLEVNFDHRQAWVPATEVVGH